MIWEQTELLIAIQYIKRLTLILLLIGIQDLFIEMMVLILQHVQIRNQTDLMFLKPVKTNG